MINELEIPKGWEIKKLEDLSEGKNGIVDGPFGSNLKTSDYINDTSGVPVLTTKNLEGDYSENKVRYISHEKFEELRRSQVLPGDILVAKIGSIGKIGVYPKNAKIAIIPANLLKFTVSKSVNSKYVLYYLMSNSLQNMIKMISTATAQPAFNVTKFRKLLIPLPPLVEQQKIVAKIEELFSELDKGKQQLETALQQLKIYRQSVLKWAFEGKLTNKEVKEGELPEGWKWVKIQHFLFDVKKGMSTGPFGTALKKFEHQATGVAVLGIENIGNGTFILPNKIFVTNEKAEELKNFRVIENDIIISRSGTVGEICAVPARMKDSIISTNLIRVRLNQEIISTKYFVYLFQGGEVKEQVFQLCKGSSRAFLNQTILSALDFPLPSLDEQQKIVQEIESRLSVCDKVEETISQSLQQAETLRQSILKKAFEGKLI